MGKILFKRRSLLAAPALLLLPRSSWARHGTALNDLPTGVSPTRPPPQGAASIQYPTLFTAGWTKLDGTTGAYATRPVWRVAGVDYYTGFDRSLYPTAPTPGGSSGSLTSVAAGGNGPVPGVTGASYNTSNQVISVSGSSASTFEGFNFDFATIKEVDVSNTGAGTVTFSNCNFVNGANSSANVWVDQGGTANIQFINCTIDMAGATVWPQVAPTDMVRNESTGSTLFSYCSILNGCQGSHSSTGGGAIQYDHCYFNGNNFASGAHGEWLKINFNSPSLPTPSVIASFNTFIFPFTDGGGATSALYPSPLGQGPIWFFQCDHNVFIFQPWQFTGGISNGSGGAGTILNITAMSGGAAGLQLVAPFGYSITGPGVTANTVITDVSGRTGTGGTGTYNVNNSQFIAPGTTLTSDILRGKSYNAGGADFPYGPIYTFANYVDPSGTTQSPKFAVTQPQNTTQIHQSVYGNINLVDGTPIT